jgi:hypothetical protein
VYPLTTKTINAINPTSNNTAIGINLGSPNGIPIIPIAIIDVRVMSTKLSGFNFSLTIQEFNLERVNF